MKNWLAKYNITTHTVGAAIASLYGMYLTVPQFHSWIEMEIAKLPHSLEAGLGAAFAVWLKYSNNSNGKAGE